MSIMFPEHFKSFLVQEKFASMQSLTYQLMKFFMEFNIFDFTLGATLLRCYTAVFSFTSGLISGTFSGNLKYQNISLEFRILRQI